MLPCIVWHVCVLVTIMLFMLVLFMVVPSVVMRSVIVLFVGVLSVIVPFMIALHMIRQAAASDWRSSMRVWQSDLPKGRRMLVKRGTFAS